MRRGTGLLVACALAVLAGCSSAGTGGSASVSPSPETSPVTPTSTPTTSGPGSGGPGSPVPGSTPTAGPGGSGTTGALIEYRRQGGFAGFSDTLVVQADGAFVLTRAKPPVSRHGQLTGAELADLRGKLAAADLAHQPQVKTSAKGNDLYVYELISGGSRVVTQDGAVPPTLSPLLSTLSGLVTKYGAQS